MTLVDILPDATKFVRAYLLGETELTSLVGQRVSTASKGTFPELRLQRIGGIPPIRQRIDAARLQFDAYGNTEGEASRVARVARALVHRMAGTVADGAVCSGVDDDLGLSWLPDTSRNPATARFIFGCVVYLHAT